MAADFFTENARQLLRKLAEVSRMGPLPGIGEGSGAVGMTLLNALGISHSSVRKPKANGIVVTARRNIPAMTRNRVNLFARVPNWDQSACKSSAEVLQKYGYAVKPGIRRLYCTVKSRQPNSQGLFLHVNRERNLLEERASIRGENVLVVAWGLEDLKRRLAATHPESIWVTANVTTRGGSELFHYRKAIYTGLPRLNQLEALLMEGTITIDHLIEERAGRTTEKGPLFKIIPSNLPLLFPCTDVFDLLSFDVEP